MKQCTKNFNLEGFVLDELNTEEQSQIKQHVSECAECAKQLESTEMVHTLLTGYERESIPQQVAEEYHTKLNQMFGREPLWKTIHHRIDDLIESFFFSRSISFGIAKMAVVLVVGIMIGYFALQPRFDKNVPSAEQFILSLSQQDVQFMKEYFTTSEMWLLSLANEPTEEVEFAIQKEFAQELLSQTDRMIKNAELLNDESVMIFLNKLETILLELSNRDEQDILETFNDLKSIIQETNMLNDTKTVQSKISKLEKDAI